MPASNPAPALAAPTHIRVVTDNNYPPYLFLDANGKPEGYEVDMWRLFQAHTGIKVELVPMQWQQAQHALLSGQADVIDMIYRTPERKDLYDFSEPYASHSVAIYVSRDIHGVHDVASLRGFPVGVESGDACVGKLRSLGVTDLRLYADYKDIIQAAVRGDARIFCMDEDPANFYLYKYSALDKFSPAFVLYQGKLRRAVRKGDAAMLQVVERGMSQVTPAERAGLRKRWLTQPLFMAPYLYMAKLALAIVAIVIVLMLLWVWMLRRSVTRRTRALQDEKDKLRTLLDASPDGLWVKDLDGVYLDCNEHVAELIGVPREQLVGHRDEEVLKPENAALIRAMEEDVMRLGRSRTHVFTPTVDEGDTRQIEVVKIPVYAQDGKVRGTLSVSRDITQRSRNEEQLRLWGHAFQHAASGMVVFDAANKSIIAVNPEFAQERGYTPEELAGKPVDVLYPADLIAERREARKDIDRREHALVETEHVTRDGRRFPVLLDCSVTHDADGEARYVIAYVRDITERKNTEKELRLAAAAFETQEALLVLDAAGKIRRVNNAFTQLTGYESDEVLGQLPSLIIPRGRDQTSAERLLTLARNKGAWQGERWVQVKQGPPRVVRSKISAVWDTDGHVSHYVCAMVDLTAEREAHASVDRMTFFDPLTELPNRNFLRGRMQQVLDANEPGVGALLMFDLDHFKRVNDLRGHAAGDRLLLLVAQRLRHHLDEQCVLGRFGGGTFALLEGCGSTDRNAASEQAWGCAERIRQALREPFHVGGDSVVIVTVSIGWTRLVAGQGSPESVLREAELAMYDAKAAGRDQVRRFQPAMQTEMLRHEALTHDLRKAIVEDGLELYMQAQVDRSGNVVGAEALLRWIRPCGEAVSPSVFVPIAEENGLVLPLGDWVLRRACSQLVVWSMQACTRDLSLAVNVSARQFAQPGFVNGVREILSATGANPKRLKLEITETTILDDLADAAAKLSELRSLGIRVSLDDFGTGYSSLAYLSRLPLDQLKIDQSFVARLPDDANDAMVAQTIVGMGRGLGLEVIAEGVETEAQWHLLMQHGCDAFQGFLFARPVPCAEFEAALGKRLVPA